jgi:hypothetical protein
MAFKDKVGSTDHVEASLSTYEPPEYPCPLCGKATKDDNTDETREADQNIRICSSRVCRAQSDFASGSGVLIP